MIKYLPSRLVCPHDSVSSLAKNFACGWPQFIIFTSHLLIFLFYPLRGKKTLVSYLERRLLLVLVLSQYSLLCYLLLLMGKMSQNKGTKSLYILTYQASRNISAKVFKHLDYTSQFSLSCCLFKRKRILRWGGQKTTSVKDELQIRLTKG